MMFDQVLGGEKKQSVFNGMLSHLSYFPLLNDDFFGRATSSIIFC
jgi:hypothetical protein